MTVRREDGPFAITGEGLYLSRQHLGSLDANSPDFVAVAERFVGTPYLWGGKSSFGIDCSGLVQLSLAAAGITSPRDSDMQQASLGRLLDPAEAKTLRRGDLLFWKGHVAIARDTGTIVHANAHHMATVTENTANAIARIRAAGSELVAIRRIKKSDARPRFVVTRQVTTNRRPRLRDGRRRRTARGYNRSAAP